MSNKFQNVTNIENRDSVPHGAPTTDAKGLAPAGFQRNSDPELRVDGIDPSGWSTTTKSIENLGNLTEKIGEGTYRDVYRYHDIAIKKTKPYVTKKFLFTKVRIPTSLYTLITFAIRDLNKYEHRQYQSIVSKMPPDLHTCFARVYKPIARSKGSYAINQLVIDDDGQLSKTLVECGRVNDKYFWSAIDELEKSFLENHIYYLGIGGHNICVNRQADGRIIPVLIDYKRIGVRTFSRQLLLYFPYFMKLKLRRRFQGIREDYRDCIRSV